ncbi:hypothetical protein BD413DRAFT_30640 [Trametes elegans]|nr:hypothetical protein BD413DRAFT_30640 [Trametes elegans]
MPWFTRFGGRFPQVQAWKLWACAVAIMHTVQWRHVATRWRQQYGSQNGRRHVSVCRHDDRRQCSCGKRCGDSLIPPAS